MKCFWKQGQVIRLIYFRKCFQKQYTGGYCCWGTVYSLSVTEKLLSHSPSLPSPPPQSKSWHKPKGMVLKSCRVRYRDSLDKTSEKQFIVNDDNGMHTT